MSRFSQAEAEAAGWNIVHQRNEREVTVAPNVVQTHPQTIVAEKYVSLPGQQGRFVHEEADSMGKLLERIHAYEQHLSNTDALGENREPFPFDTDAEVPRFSPLRGDDQPEGLGDPAESVVFPTEPGDLTIDAPVETMTDAEWSARTRADTLVVKNEDGDFEQVVYAGGTEGAENAESLRLANKKAIEDRRAAEPAVGPVEQLTELSVSNADNTGSAAGFTVVVREGESPTEALERKEDLKKMREEGRVGSQVNSGFAARAPEGADKLAGVDVGIQERSDLGSDTPGLGDTAGTLAEPDNEQEASPPAPHLYPVGVDKSDEVAAAAPSEPSTISEAEEQRDEADADAYEARDTAESENGPNATPAAEARAEELGVDISQVEGSGKDGRVTAPDVEAAAASASEQDE